MTRATDAPFKDEAPGRKPPRKSPVHIDWKRGARLFAAGSRPAAIAAALGIDEDRFWRHLKQSLRFRFYIRQALEREGQVTDLQFAVAARAAVLSRSLQSDSLDADLLKCLMAAPGAPPDGAPRDTATPDPAAPAAADLARRVERLGATGTRPPNMAQRARMAAEKDLADKMAAMRADLAVLRPIAAHLARSRPAAANPGEPPRIPANAGEAARSATNPGEAARSVTKPHEPPRTSPTPPEAMRSAANPGEAASVQRPPRPPAPEPRSRAALLGSIVDLDGPDLARIRALGGFDAEAPPD